MAEADRLLASLAPDHLAREPAIGLGELGPVPAQRFGLVLQVLKRVPRPPVQFFHGHERRREEFARARKVMRRSELSQRTIVNPHQIERREAGPDDVAAQITRDRGAVPRLSPRWERSAAR